MQPGTKSFLISVVIAFLFSCNPQTNRAVEILNSPIKQRNIQEFWNWFVDNKEQFENLDERRDEKLNLIAEHLHQIQPNLSIEISKEKEGIRRIEISADGDINQFSLVKEIVEFAPKIKGWEIIAFRQPITEDFTLEYEGIKLTPSELYFVPYTEGDSLDVVIYGKGFAKYDYKKLSYYGFVMLDNLMGEYNCVTKVRYYDFQDLEEVKDTSNLRPLPEINAFTEDFSKNRLTN